MARAMGVRQLTGYRDIAADLRDAITRGEYRPGQTIPKLEELMRRYSVGKETARRAVALLQAEGMVNPVRRRGTVVRDPAPVRLSVDRYRDVLSAPGVLGPWETAAAHQSTPGRTDLVQVDQIRSGDDIGSLLGLAPDAPVIRRLQHMSAGDRVLQIQETWIPGVIAAGTSLTSTDKIIGGIYRALTTLGHSPAWAQETVTSRMPTRDEASTLHLDPGIPVLTATRVTRDADGVPLVAARAVMAGDRVQLVYDQAFRQEG
jgi:GntR family transcriptional regulator